MVFSSASTARAIRSRATLRSSSWSGSLTSGVGDETASRVESVMAYPFLLVVIVLVINQQDTPLFQIAPYTRNEHSSDHFFINDKAFIITSEDESLGYLTAVLNSSLFRCCFKDNFPELLGKTYEVRKVFVDKIPVKKPDASQRSLFEALVALVQAATAAADTGKERLSMVADFFTQVIDACVMEVYFGDHMAEKNLAISAHVQPLLPPDAASLNVADQVRAARAFYEQANASDHPIRDMLLRIPAESPDLLAVIQRKGSV